MNFPFYIAGRYTISRSKNTAVNIITAISALGIVASTAALFIILSAFGGLKEYTVSFSNATDPDLTVVPQLGKSFLISAEQEKQLKKVEGISEYSMIAEERVLFYFDGKEHVAYLKGSDSIFTNVSGFNKQLIAGQWLEPETSQCVVGLGTTVKLSLGLFDFNRSLEVYVPKPGKGAINKPGDAFKKSVLIPVGVYSVNDEIDSKYVFCDLGLAQELLLFKPNQVSGIEIKLKDGASENEVRQKLSAIFNNSLNVKNRAQLNESLYRMLNAENLVTYLFCSLVVVMTLFCLAGALIMLILDKKENIKTLFSLGTPVTSLRNIFLNLGLFITGIGTITGILIGTAVVLLQKHFKLLMLTNELAYPVSFSFVNIGLVLLTIFTLGFIVSYIAAARVNKKLLEI
ncbi:ABC transporter permease [Flavobacterium sp. MK4S-17]|uniref:ABC transporter permease n=1 Tax=Flavobacterium sp. MK4S-17 TaxID=2543737 RepID=UPI00135857AE|nr:ABC transporter permease [Flavobacterium sp. MK4S-17]